MKLTLDDSNTSGIIAGFHSLTYMNKLLCGNFILKNVAAMVKFFYLHIYIFSHIR